MKACFKLEPASFETGGKTAGQIVLLQQQTGISALEDADRRDKPAVAGADDHSIILFACFSFHSILSFSFIPADYVLFPASNHTPLHYRSSYSV